jgi:hypothetical protein
MDITAVIKSVVVEGGIIRVKVEFSDLDVQVLQFTGDSTADGIQGAIVDILKAKNVTYKTADAFATLIGSTVSVNKESEDVKVEGALVGAVQAAIAKKAAVIEAELVN